MSKFHINKHGVPAPCKATKGNCPLGGEGEHFDTLSEAQEHVDKKFESQHGIISGVCPLGGMGDFNSMEEAHSAADANIQSQYNIDEYYQGNKYQATGSAMREPMNKDNVKQVLDKGLSEEDLSVSYNTESFLNTPVELKANVSKVGEDEYKVEGEVYEYSMVEEDFDSEEEFSDYLSGGPDTVYDVDFKFSSGELKNTLVSHGRIGDKSTDPKETRGTILAGVYDMSRDNLE